MTGNEQAVATSPAAASRVEEILRAACRVVVRNGASDLRIGTVAVEAGVSRTLVHYYFTTRQELIRAAFAFAEKLRTDALETELATLSTGAERAERALLRAIDSALDAVPALWNEVWSSLRYDDELLPIVQERYRAWADRIVQLLEEGRRDGSVPPSVDSLGAGWRLVAAAEGIDAILYLGLLDHDDARALLSSCVAQELGNEHAVAM